MLFKLNQIVKMKFSLETGEVIGRAEYTTGEDHYLIRYMAGDKRQVETWWAESALEE